jgi:hypothetical protein
MLFTPGRAEAFCLLIDADAVPVVHQDPLRPVEKKPAQIAINDDFGRGPVMNAVAIINEAQKRVRMVEWNFSENDIKRAFDFMRTAPPMFEQLPDDFKLEAGALGVVKPR